MQKETQKQKEERLARRNYLRQLDEKLNANKSKKTKIKEPVIAEQEVNEASNEDALFSGEE